jgi:hypothetical protein
MVVDWVRRADSAADVLIQRDAHQHTGGVLVMFVIIGLLPYLATTRRLLSHSTTSHAISRLTINASEYQAM